MTRGNVFFEVEKIEQLALINRLTTHHDLRPSLKASDDGIMIRQYPRGLFQHHRSKSVLWLCPLHGRFSTKNRHSSARIQRPFRAMTGLIHCARRSQRAAKNYIFNPKR